VIQLGISEQRELEGSMDEALIADTTAPADIVLQEGAEFLSPSSFMSLEERITSLGDSLQEASPDPESIFGKLGAFKQALTIWARKGWNGGQGTEPFYSDDWSVVYKQRYLRDESFSGTTLDGATLTEVLFDGADLPAVEEGVRFLRHARKYTPRGGEQYRDLIEPVSALADEMFDTAFERCLEQKNYAALGELCVGADFLPAAAAYVAEADNQGEAAAEIVALTESCVAAAQKLSECFHPELSRKVQEAFLRVGLKFVFGLAQHRENGYTTHDILRLSDSFQLPVDLLRVDDPTALLRELFTSVGEIHQAVTDKQSMVTPVLQSQDFALFRFVTTSSHERSSNVQEYIRPLGGYAYDPTYEFGRPREGVEASHSFVHSKRSFLHYPKDGRDRSTLSIRIDFEGVDPTRGRDPLAADRDPTNRVGTLSLDIGSILGNGGNRGVKIGRFLAWCDQLRTVDAYRRDRPSFNHGYEAFATGDREVFAAQLRDVIQQRTTDSRFATVQDLAHFAVLDAQD
jgi:hypothetical protein